MRIEIDKNKVLLPGDRIELHFKTTGLVWLQAAQIALIEERVKNRSDWQIISNSLPANNRVIFTIEIIEPPEPGLQRAGVGVTAANVPVRIISKTATTLTIDEDSDTAINNITVLTPDPVFKTMAVLGA